MDSETENELVPGIDPGATENATPEVSLQKRLWQRLRRLRRNRLIMVVGAAILMMLLAVWTVIALVSTDDDTDVDPATIVLQDTAPISFQAALAQTVQAGDDTIWLHDFSPTTEQLETLACIERLRILRIDNGSLTPQAGEVFAAMPHLEQVHFRGVSMDDATLDAIAKSTTIWLLNLAGAQLSPEAIARLANMPRLTQLRLVVKDGGNRYTQPIASIRKLRSLHLVGFGVNNQGLKLLADMPNLESLYIDDSNINDDGWMWLFENKPHLHVHIDQKHHDRDPQMH